MSFIGPDGPGFPQGVEGGCPTKPQRKCMCIKMMELDKYNYLRGIGDFLGFPVFGYHEPGSDQDMRDNFSKKQGTLLIPRPKAAKAGLGEVITPTTSKIVVKILFQKLAMFL